MMQVEG